MGEHVAGDSAGPSGRSRPLEGEDQPPQLPALRRPAPRNSQRFPPQAEEAGAGEHREKLGLLVEIRSKRNTGLPPPRPHHGEHSLPLFSVDDLIKKFEVFIPIEDFPAANGPLNSSRKFVCFPQSLLAVRRSCKETTYWDHSV
eukprot:CAMPEP_0172622978 /NCGR_PEP_ID=MMETSP1068-20121228/124783_1 /TAXON_ID=35684 /ORGANISM="Pseudopedinella elastica, Strain CCMP716" /LENGTH=142 /DNA_ID=CAMNT_0013431347 /DNA_START=440 /DNA_END=869 /DNA_ORIENTATION=+